MNRISQPVFQLKERGLLSVRKRTIIQNFWTENEKDVINFCKNIVRRRFHEVVRSIQMVCHVDLCTLNILIFKTNLTDLERNVFYAFYYVFYIHIIYIKLDVFYSIQHKVVFPKEYGSIKIHSTIRT